MINLSKIEKDEDIKEALIDIFESKVELSDVFFENIEVSLGIVSFDFKVDNYETISYDVLELLIELITSHGGSDIKFGENSDFGDYWMVFSVV